MSVHLPPSGGSCATLDPDLFVGPDNEDQAPRIAREKHAKRTCWACPVMQECQAWALTLDVRAKVGVAGGLTDAERRRLRAYLAEPPAASPRELVNA